MASKMDMSLDDIITSTKTRRGGGRGRGNRRGGAGGRGAGNRPVGARTTRGGAGGNRRGAGAGGRPSFRTGGGARGSNAEAGGVWKHDKFQDALGGGARSKAVGVATRGPGSTKITISNLHYGVSDSDIIELFGELGNIRYASVHYDRSGRSMGKADVTFERRAEAQAAIQQYNGVPLDGRPMQITWAVPVAATTQQVSPRGSNLRQIQGKRIGRGSGGGAPRGRRGGARGGGRGGKTPAGKAPTAEELDAELDAYASNRV